MSLICGILSRNNPKHASAEALDAMLGASRHRARDGTSSFIDAADGIALAHAHTATFGQRPDAPAWFEDPNLVAAVDGDIYDADSQMRGVDIQAGANPFAAAVSASYEASRENFPAALDGFFSLFLWDRRSKTLHISTDPFSRKLVYFYYESASGLLVFSTELKAVLSHSAVPRQLDDRVLPLYLSRTFTAAPFTLAKGVRKLHSAECLTSALGETNSRRYWRPPRAVRRIIGGAEKVAVNLSGGLDSSLVLATLKELSGCDVKAFTLGFKGNTNPADLEGAQRVAQQTGTPQETLIVDPETDVTLESMEILLRQMDEPFASASRMASEYFLGQASIQAGFTSTLTGATPGGGMRRVREIREADPEFDSRGIEEILIANFKTPPYNNEDRINHTLARPADMTTFYQVSLANLELLRDLDQVRALMMERRLRSSTSRNSLFYQFGPPLWGLEERTPFLDTRFALLLVSIPPVLWGLESKQYDRAPLTGSYRRTLNLDPAQRAKGAFPSAPQPALAQAHFGA